MNTANINIPKNVDDPFHRYKRNAVETVFVSKKGGQTEILNLVQIAKQLNRDVETLLKHIKKTLNTGIAKSENEKYRVKGYIGANEVDNVVEDYIKRFIICKNCGNPETSKRFRCKACGFKSQME
jgi:translation initiation factor 5